MIWRCALLVDFLGGMLDAFEEGVLWECGGNLFNILYNNAELDDTRWDGGGDEERL